MPRVPPRAQVMAGCDHRCYFAGQTIANRDKVLVKIDIDGGSLAVSSGNSMFGSNVLSHIKGLLA